MEIKFYTERGVLDLSSQKISFQESNSKMSDKALTKFSFPFEIFLDENFIHYFGDYRSHESRDLAKVIEGRLHFEGKIHEAKLEILSIEGNFLTGQLDFGFEQIPNYDKKLSELPLERFEVANIYEYAVEICEKKYPETNFNFPRIHTKKFSPTDKMWDAFEGYYNHTIIRDGKLRMAENVFPTEQNNWTIDNVNIIHPCPHILYLLKAGFADAGFSLAGDILQDKDLAQKWVFSGGQYFRNKWIQSQEKTFNRKDYSELIEEDIYNAEPDGETYHSTHHTYIYRHSLILEKTDQYRLDFFAFNNSWIGFKVKYNGTLIMDGQIRGGNSIFLKTTENTIIEIEATYNIRADYYESDPIWSFRLRSQMGVEEKNTSYNVQETKIVENENIVDLTRAVPDMTFNELVNIVRNWFNYDLKIVDKTVYMNLIGVEEPPEAKDFRAYEIKNPKRSLLVNKSYLLKFPEMEEGYFLDSMFYDRNGAKLNGKENENTSIIEINGYALPVGKAKEYHTATAQVKVDSDTILGLVQYEGLDRDGINNATYLPGCHFPELFDKNWEKWLRQRVTCEEYNWQFLANDEAFSSISISDHLFCYQKNHIIKTMTKDKLTKDVYQVDRTTETY